MKKTSRERVIQKIISDIFKKLPTRDETSHKYDFGHCLFIGGNVGMPGAIRLSSQMALRSGCGLVSVATVKENVPIVIQDLYELMVKPVTSIQALEEMVKKVNCIVIGPGLGRDKWAKMCCDFSFNQDIPKVIDADALHFLDSKVKNSIITPHEGEAKTVLKDQYSSNRDECISDLLKFSDIALLKGSKTIVSNTNSTYINDSGHPSLATAGSGDVLSGLIGSLCSQGLDLYEAGVLGTFLHGKACEEIVKKTNCPTGIVASDLIEEVRILLNSRSIFQD